MKGVPPSIAGGYWASGSAEMAGVGPPAMPTGSDATETGLAGGGAGTAGGAATGAGAECTGFGAAVVFGFEPRPIEAARRAANEPGFVVLFIACVIS